MKTRAPEETPWVKIPELADMPVNFHGVIGQLAVRFFDAADVVVEHDIAAAVEAHWAARP